MHNTHSLDLADGYCHTHRRNCDLSDPAPMSRVADLSTAGLEILASDSRMTAVYLTATFGEVVVDRAGVVWMATDYDAAHGAR